MEVDHMSRVRNCLLGNPTISSSETPGSHWTLHHLHLEKRNINRVLSTDSPYYSTMIERIDRPTERKKHEQNNPIRTVDS
nr:MAG TPA: hypothetical protein [Caudoviricetes sp.]